jgi:(p)ppGpp synthase/HD superfamily hydrolase
VTHTVLGPRFADAIAFATAVHRDQVRKQTTIPYVSHLLAVASLVLDQGGDEAEAIAALLHDTLEDHPDKTSAEDIQARFGRKVSDIVVACSDATSHPKPPWQARKDAYLAHLETAGADVLRVSLADKLHNARAIVADLRVAGPAVWDRFGAGRDQQLWYYRSLLDVFRRRADSPLVTELEVAVAEMERLAA